MKKLVSVCFACLLLTFAAGAANVGTIDNRYPGDTEAQAQMLYDLGLFRGTEKGFELEKPMTRAEAAAMLTRFLGAEQTALAGKWTHPFTDVPQWADKYVGWLYESGLTKGVSATQYGAAKHITCDQYCTFLARVARGEDAYQFLLHFGEEEVDACDAAGFIRGDAVALSARLMGEYDIKEDAFSRFTVAGTLIEKGVFTAEQLKEAAWDVLPRTYERMEISPDSEEQALSCVIAGVSVARCADTGIYALYAPGLNQLYGYLDEEERGYHLFSLDPKTLDCTELLNNDSQSMVSAMGSAGPTDYLMMTDVSKKNNTIYAVRGVLANPVMDLPMDAKNLALFSCLQGENGCVFQYDENTFYCLEENGIRALPLSNGARLAKVLSDGLLVLEDVSLDRTIVSGWTWDGKPAGSFTVENRYSIPEGLKQEASDSVSYWLDLYAPQVQNDNGTYAWGTAGLYRVVDGALVQITDQPVYDCKIDPVDGSCVLLTSPADERPGFYGGGTYTLAGTQVMRIAQDGTSTMLLSNDPDHGLNFSEISLAEAGKVHVVYTYVMGMADTHQYEYSVEGGKLRALVHTPGMGYAGYTDEECAAEQARLDELGVGVGAK